jgi:hypothetical protein
MRTLTSGFAVVLACCWTTAAAGQEPTVARVVAEGAIVRISPVADAAVVATPALGSLLDISGIKGDWVIILMPANDAGLRRYGYILRRSVEILDKSAVPTLPKPGGSAAATAPAPLAADWRVRYDQAAGRKRAGRVKRWSGVGIVAGGGALIGLMTLKVLDQGADRNCTDADPCYEYAWGLGGGVGMMVAGGILSSRGKRQMASADLDLIRLETERLNARPKMPVPYVIPIAGSAAWASAIGFSTDRIQGTFRLSW